MDGSGGSVAAAAGDSLTKKGKENANKIITLRRRRGMLYAGLDVHKMSIQVAVLDAKGTILLNERIAHTPEAVRGMGRPPAGPHQVRHGVLLCLGGDVPPDDRGDGP